LTVTALDNVQNSTSTAVTFFYDIQKPTSSVTSPNTVYITPGGQIQGNASDQLAANPSGLSANGVSVAVQLLTGALSRPGAIGGTALGSYLTTRFIKRLPL